MPIRSIVTSTKTLHPTNTTNLHASNVIINRISRTITDIPNPSSSLILIPVLDILPRTTLMSIVGGGTSRIRIKIIRAKREVIGVGMSVKFLKAEVEGVLVVVEIGKNLQTISNGRMINHEMNQLPIVHSSSDPFRIHGTTLDSRLGPLGFSLLLGLEKVGFYTPLSWVIVAR